MRFTNMQSQKSISIKWIQSYCILLIIGKIACDSLLIKDSFDDQMLEQKAGCIAICMQSNFTAVSIINYENNFFFFMENIYK